MRLLKPYTPRYDFCVVCGKESKEESCPGSCSVKLEALRNAIENQKEVDKHKGDSTMTEDLRHLRQYNLLQEILDR